MLNRIFVLTQERLLYFCKKENKPHKNEISFYFLGCHAGCNFYNYKQICYQLTHTPMNCLVNTYFKTDSGNKFGALELRTTHLVHIMMVQF